ncbi:hypothetical protein B0H34DRAFT_800843 [Crassisporium funariophilum]|nr:hypothetical protein B0H34DRAFT_800843 [Crassisporium funariophilum]
MHHTKVYLLLQAVQVLWAKTNGKVTEQMFSSTVLPLAKASKDAMRTKVVYGDVFPPNDVAGCFAYIWGLIKDTAKGNSTFQDALQEASDDEDVKRILVTFAMYGRNAMFNSIVSKARSMVEAHYKLGGTLDKVKSDVDWLLEDANFMYGDIDLEIEHGLKEFSMGRQGMCDFTETIAKTRSKSNIQSTVNTCQVSAKNIAKVDSRELEKIAEEA